MNLSFDWLSFDRLALAELYALLNLRERVFVVEQKCAYLDADGLDPKCMHALGRSDGKLVATARIVPPGEKFEEPSIGRVVTAPDVRRQGAGRLLMQSAISQTLALYPGRSICLAAQRYLEYFYKSFGFEPFGAPYDEDGIPHIDMILSGGAHLQTRQSR